VRTLAPAPGTASVSADDRGIFRIFDVPPGQYVVQAARQSFFGFGVLHQVTADEARAAARIIASGSHTPVTGDGLFIDQGRPSDYSPIYYPGTADVAGAALVTVGSNQEAAGIDFSLMLAPTARVSGRVETPGGEAPRHLTMRLVSRGTPVMAESGAGVAATLRQINNVPQLSPDGAFTIASLAPGRYTLIARAADDPADSAAGASAGAQNLWAMLDVDVNGLDLANIQLRLQAALHISGRVVFDGSAQLPDDVKRRIRLSAEGRFGPAAIGGGTFGLDGSGLFDIGNLIPGRYRMIVQMPAGVSGSWTAASALIDGRDALDAPVEIRPGDDLSHVIVRLTDRSAELSGTIRTPSGAPDTEHDVAIFAADQSLWGLSGRRLPPPVHVDRNGSFRFADLPAGDYIVAISTDITADDLRDPAVLTDLASRGVRVTIAEGQKAVQDFKIGPGLRHDQ